VNLVEIAFKNCADRAVFELDRAPDQLLPLGEENFGISARISVRLIRTKQ
jgi:hypothetical protein